MKKISACLLLAALALSVAISDAAVPSLVELQARKFMPEAGTDALDITLQDNAESHHFLVQLGRFADDALRADLRAAGVELLQYIPQNTWIASFDRQAIESHDVRSQFVWVGEILPTDKMPTRWQNGEIGPWAFEEDGRLEMRVRFHKDVDVDAARARLESLGAEMVAPMSIFKGYTIIANTWLIESIAEMDEVEWISEGLQDSPVIHNDGCRQMSGAGGCQTPPYGLDGAGVHAAVWDNGVIDDDHDDFEGRLVRGESGGTASHCTHVGGTVGGSGILSEAHGGTALQWRGMAPGVTLFSWNFYGDVPNEIENGIEEHDLDLETNSWSWGVDGGNCYMYGDYDSWAPDFDALTTGAGGKYVNIIFSASNERDDGDCDLLEGSYACIPPPCTAKNVITVGATNSDDDTMTDFSSWGPVDDGRLKPDVSAPGCETGGEGAVKSTEPGDTYSLKCGTSMAAPTVTGNLALLYQLYNNQNGGADPDPAMMKALLIATAVDRGNPGPDYAFGHGRIDVVAAADAMLFDTQMAFTVGHGENVEYSFTVPEGVSKLRFALVWHDPPASSMSNPALINNIDMVLFCPNSNPHYPWVVNPSSPSANATKGTDALNNVEHIEVNNPDSGLWRVRISGTNVPQGPQPVGLVGLDFNPPQPPIDFAVVGSTETLIRLKWTNCGSRDREGTLIARSVEPLTWSGPADGETYTVGEIVEPGVEIIYVADLDHTMIPFTDRDLDPGTTYEYAAYTFDDMLNYSEVASATGTTAGTESVEQIGDAPAVLALGAAKPNPAHTQVGFSFSLPTDTHAAVRFYDPAGRLVRTLVDAPMSAGTYSASWDGRDDEGRTVATGIYFYELRANGERLSRQVSWMR